MLVVDVAQRFGIVLETKAFALLIGADARVIAKSAANGALIAVR